MFKTGAKDVRKGKERATTKKKKPPEHPRRVIKERKYMKADIANAHCRQWTVNGARH